MDWGGIMDYEKMIDGVLLGGYASDEASIKLESLSPLTVIKEDWKHNIEVAYEDVPLIVREQLNEVTNKFYDTIWDMSITAFDIPREVQVLVDANDTLFISVGNPGYVSFQGQDDELYGKNVKMKFPLKNWIHTHPFGLAYFSGTDMRTITLYQRHMKMATVLAGNERQYVEFFPDGSNRVEFIKTLPSLFNQGDHTDE